MPLNLPSFTGTTNAIANFLQDNAHSYCNLLCASVIDPYSMVCVDGSVITAVEIIGTHRYLTPETEVQYLSELNDKLESTLRDGHHSLGLMYVRDPGRTATQLELCFHSTIDTIRRLGIEAEHFYEAQKKDLEANCAFERTLLIIKTTRHAVQHQPQELPRLAEQKIVVDIVPPLLQNTLRDSEQLIQQHKSYTGVVLGALNTYMSVKKITNETYLKYLKEEESLTNMSATDWRSHSIKTPVDLTLNQKEADFITHPPIAYQLITDEKEISPSSSGIIDNGTHHVATLDREFFHIKELTTFNDLFTTIERDVPFRMYYELQTGTEDIRSELSARKTWLMFFMVSRAGRETNTALTSLMDLADNENKSLLKGTLSIATWADDLKTAQQYKKDIKQALQSWGAMTPRVPSNKFKGYYSTLPGFSKKQSARSCVQTSERHLTTLPLTRPAAPISSGAMCLSSLDGKLVPIDPVTNAQDYGATAIAGSPKSGKTVFSSIYNNAIVFSAGNHDLPPMSYTDFGSGVHNYLQSLRAWLPHSQRYKIADITLTNTIGNAFNILEPQFGLTTLEHSERAFATAFLTRIVNGISTKTASGQLNNALIKILSLFEEECREKPLRYEPKLGEYVNAEQRLHQEVNLLLDNGTIEVKQNEAYSWHTIRDKLFQLPDNEYFEHARFCHRQGSHDLTDMVTFLIQSDKVANALSSYRVEGASEVHLKDYIYSSLLSLTERFSNIFGKKSQIDISQARVVGVDLKGATGQGNDPDTVFCKQIFGMLGKYISSRNFWRDPKTFLDIVPPLYTEHYRAILKSEESLKKHQFMDEYLQMSSEELDNLLSQEVNVARKYNMVITICSQRLAHMPVKYLESATNIYCLSVTESDCEFLQKQYNLSPSFISEIKRKVRTDTEFGRIILYIGKYTNYQGYVVQLLRNQITSSYLWNFASDKWDEIIKKQARLKYGEKTAFLKLAKLFPHGSALSEVESRMEQSKFSSQPLTNQEAINELVKSLDYVEVGQ